jgi:RNA polymerase sigma-70 factor (ECF subfamily)
MLASDMPPSPPDADADLIQAVQRGDRARFHGLVDRYKQRLFAYIVYRLGDPDTAEDLTQDVFLQVFRAAIGSGFHQRCSIKTWLFTIANNRITDQLRADGRRRRVVSDEPDVQERANPPGPAAAADDADPLRILLKREAVQRANAILQMLPAEQCEAITLRIHGGLRFAEIAEVVGCPVATAKSRMRYGLIKIHDILMAEEEVHHD